MSRRTTIGRRVRAGLLTVVTTLMLGLQVAGAAPVGAVTDAPVVAGPSGTVEAQAGPSVSQPAVARVPGGATVSIDCTSYVAWRLNQAGVPFSNTYGGVHWGNANNWDDAARALAAVPGFEHVTVDPTPEVGDVAQSNGGAFGHVAYVADVNPNDTVDVQEYNYDVENGVTDHNFNQRTVPTSSFNYVDLDG